MSIGAETLTTHLPKEAKRTQRWVIHHFSQLPFSLSTHVDSPVFSCVGHKWQMRLYPVSLARCRTAL